MSSKVSFLFPGQGAYIPGVFTHGHERHPAVQDVLQSIDAVSLEYWGARVSPLLLDAQAPEIETLLDQQSEILHLAIFAASVVSSELFSTLGVRPDVVVGHSFGEVAAAVAAGMLTTADAARAICERDKALQRFPPPPGGLMALSLNARRARQLLSVVDEWGLDLAVDNGPHQTVVAGTTAALDKVGKVAAALDIAAVRLPARYPFHSRLLYDAADEFAVRASEIPAREPRCRLYSPILGEYALDASYVRQLSARHFTQPVRFREALQVLYADGVRVFVSCGAREILDRLVSANLPADVTVLTPFARRADMEQVKRVLEPVLVGKAGVTATLPSAPVPRNGNAAEEFANLVRSEGIAELAPIPSVTSNGSNAPNSATDLPKGDQLIEALRDVYAETLGYPREVLTDEADLEADLGIDSIKQVETFAQLRKRFNLPDPPEGLRPTAYTTLPAVATLLRRLNTGIERTAERS